MKYFNSNEIAIVGCGYWGTNIVKTLESLNIKNIVCFDTNKQNLNVILKSNNSLIYKSLESFKKMFSEKHINNDTIVFNNLVKTVGEYKNIWEIELKNSWHNKFVKNNL